MRTLPIRFTPGQDLRDALQEALRQSGCSAAFVLQGIGSLNAAHVRMADADSALRIDGPLEILTLAGTLSADGPHLHMSVSDQDGKVSGGHVSPGCIVRTTAEVLLVLLPDFHFGREQDGETGYPELRI